MSHPRPSKGGAYTIDDDGKLVRAPEPAPPSAGTEAEREPDAQPAEEPPAPSGRVRAALSSLVR